MTPEAIASAALAVIAGLIFALMIVAALFIREWDSDEEEPQGPLPPHFGGLVGEHSYGVEDWPHRGNFGSDEVPHD